MQQCLHVFRFQYDQNPVYRQWCDLTGVDPATVKTHAASPRCLFLFLKHICYHTDFIPELVFESSGTTKTSTSSRHLVKDGRSLPAKFSHGFSTMFYGPMLRIGAYLACCLLTSSGSIHRWCMMVDELISKAATRIQWLLPGRSPKTANTLQELESQRAKDLADRSNLSACWILQRLFPSNFASIPYIMETGGMKGRRKELTRAEVHVLSEGNWVKQVHSEYGMTELLSQAYSKGAGRFYLPALDAGAGTR
jgi:hypothetical protein